MVYSKIYQIVHLSKYYPPYRGGIETHVQTLARSQANLGFRVYVICINSFDESGNFSLKTKMIQEIDKNVTIIRVAKWGQIAKFDICPGIAKEVRKFLADPNTIIHLHTPNPTMLLALTRIFRSMNLVITHHSDVIKQKILKYALRPFEYSIYSRSRRILTTSPEYIKGSRFLQFYEETVDYLPLALESSDYANPHPAAIAYSRHLKETYSEPIWLAVGRLVYYKAFHIAIEALKYTQGKLMIIGIGSLENELKTLAQTLGVEDRVIWLGSVSQAELIGAYHAATALWFPSNLRSEGFGLVQVEAMACGCPVINAAIPGSGVAWVSRHEQEALTVPLNDPVALGNAANLLLTEPGLRDRLAMAGRDRANYFDPITMAKRSLEFYESVLDQKS
jgi:glycosyltransferase involved in cell wall biosynthesis